MKKIVYYIPAIIFTAFYGFLAIEGVQSITLPIVITWLILFWVSGIILSKNMFWGSFLGMLPAIHLIYMGTQETGQVVSETPIGIVVLIFYIACGGFLFYKRKKKA